MHASIVVVALAAALVSAKTFVITVADGTGPDNTTVFTPQRVDAVVGDFITFNFTQGNHTATQSTFAAPCIPAHESNSSINGFDSGFRPAGNGTAITILSVPILTQNFGEGPMWFYDAATCGTGGVGAINDDESSNATLAGFVRNAERLNGTDATSTSSSASSTSGPTGTSSSSGSTQSSSSSASRTALSAHTILPLLFLALGLTAL